jgi:Transposase
VTTSLGITVSVPNARAENRRAAAEPLCDLCRGSDPAEARAYLKQWCTSAKRCRLPAFANLVRWIEKHFDAIITARGARPVQQPH